MKRSLFFQKESSPDNKTKVQRSRKARKNLTAVDLGVDVFEGDDGLFRWFLACCLFGKPIQASVAIDTWQLLIDKKLDTPWAIAQLRHRQLVRILDEGKYTRYDESTARSLQQCMHQLIDWYEGSLVLMIEQSENEDELSKRLQKLYGVGPKVAEIFMRETEEFFARRME
jgi:endonuclease III